jgi:AcrR family transcriptional regulator
MPEPVSSPKTKFIDTARRLFAERGFYGVSLADVAKELGLTKQSVLYHFSTKEKLYGAVIADIAARLDGLVDSVLTEEGDGEARFRRFVEMLYGHMRDDPLDARLILRELLDNLDRAQTSRTWYLRRFLETSSELMKRRPAWRDRPAAEHDAAVYQLIGAVNYFAVSGATLEAIWGADRLGGVETAFLPTLLRQSGLD